MENIYEGSEVSEVIASTLKICPLDVHPWLNSKDIKFDADIISRPSSNKV
jgi:hypothetical protein